MFNNTWGITLKSWKIFKQQHTGNGKLCPLRCQGHGRAREVDPLREGTSRGWRSYLRDGAEVRAGSPPHPTDGRGTEGPPSVWGLGMKWSATVSGRSKWSAWPSTCTLACNQDLIYTLPKKKLLPILKYPLNAVRPARIHACAHMRPHLRPRTPSLSSVQDLINFVSAFFIAANQIFPG